MLAEFALNLRDQGIALIIDGILRIKQGASFVVALRLQESPVSAFAGHTDC